MKIFGILIKIAFGLFSAIVLSFTLLAIGFELTDARRSFVSGIDINGVDGSFYSHLSNQEFYEVKGSINGVQKGDVSALKKLVRYDCGGGADCYGLGHILAQLAYQLGDDKISQMAQQLNETDRSYFYGLLGAGLEYGYYIQAPDEQEKALPKLHAVLKN